nr:glycogen/starch synthase [Bilophila sp.]
MRVLMFGWEFPPYKSGGLGTACYGMGRALAKKGTEILFVLPQTPLDAPVRVGERLSLCSASGTRVERTARNLRINEEVRELWREKLHIEHVDSLLLPYDTPESYDERRRELERLQSVKRNADVFSSTQETILRLHGGYGPDLMSEVYRYACAAVAIARKARFDVIHVHDWMTYPAGILVRKLTGKPLVAHIHALEHDRSGDNMNRDVAGIERAGLEAADRVVAVSHYTKRLVMRQYGIPGDKIEVVHNAVSRSEADRV